MIAHINQQHLIRKNKRTLQQSINRDINRIYLITTRIAILPFGNNILAQLLIEKNMPLYFTSKILCYRDIISFQAVLYHVLQKSNIMNNK